MGGYIYSRCKKNRYSARYLRNQAQYKVYELCFNIGEISLCNQNRRKTENRSVNFLLITMYGNVRCSEKESDCVIDSSVSLENSKMHENPLSHYSVYRVTVFGIFDLFSG